MQLLVCLLLVSTELNFEYNDRRKKIYPMNSNLNTEGPTTGTEKKGSFCVAAAHFYFFNAVVDRARYTGVR